MPEFQRHFIGYCNTSPWYIIPIENERLKLNLTIKGENVGWYVRFKGQSQNNVKLKGRPMDQHLGLFPIRLFLVMWSSCTWPKRLDRGHPNQLMVLAAPLCAHRYKGGILAAVIYECSPQPCCFPKSVKHCTDHSLRTSNGKVGTSSWCSRTVPDCRWRPEGDPADHVVHLDYGSRLHHPGDDGFIFSACNASLSHCYVVN
jgi:hypothetical protein